MKVSNIKDVDKFFEVVDSCNGKVELVTGEGDRLNLKSKLSQYVSLANIFSGGEIPELEIVAYEKEDIDKFFEVVDSCKGRVELVTGEGDRLNLKSKLSQYVSLANIFSGGEIPELEIVAAEKEDIDKLMSFMING